MTYLISVVNMFGPPLKQTNHIHVLVDRTFETVTAQQAEWISWCTDTGLKSLVSNKVFLKKRVCWDFLRGDLHQVCPLIFSPSFYRTLEETFLFSLSSVLLTSSHFSVTFLFFWVVVFFGDDGVFYRSPCFFSVLLSLRLPVNSIFHHALSKDGIHPFKGLKPAARQANSPRTEPSKTYSWLRPQNPPIRICKWMPQWHTAQFILCTYLMFSENPKR